MRPGSATLGASSVQVTPVGIGCMSMTGGPSDGNREIIQSAFEQGITWFDTADMYEQGQNEIMLGQSVRPFRQQVVLATKVGNRWRADGSGWDWAPGKSYILSQVEQSLKRLQTDYIDLYQLHGGTREDPMDEIIEAFERLVESGKIRAYGLSSIRPNVFQELVRHSAVASNMMPYSVLDRRAEDYFAFFKESGVDIIARGPLTQGLLIDKAAKEYLDYSATQVAQTRQHVLQVADKLGQSATQVLLRYVLGSEPIRSALVGVRSMAQLEDLIRATQDLSPLQGSDRTLLESGIERGHYTAHVH